MTFTSSSLLPSKNLIQGQTLPSYSTHQTTLSTNPKSFGSVKPISTVHATEPSNSPIVPDKPPPKPTTTVMAVAKPNTTRQKWTLDSKKTKEARQLLDYPDQEELESVLRTLDVFPLLCSLGRPGI